MILASDDFNRADSATLGANWTALAGTAGIVSNQCDSKTFDGSGRCVQFYSAITWPDDHYSEVTLGSVAASASPGPMVRVASGALTYYICFCNTVSDLNLASVVAGAFTGIGTLPVFNVGDVVRLEAAGSTLRVYQNSAVVLTVVDTSITSGSAGLNAGFTTVDQKVDNWSGGTVDPLGPANIVSSAGRYIGWTL